MVSRYFCRSFVFRVLFAILLSSIFILLVLLSYKSGRTSGPMQSKLLANHSEKFGNFSIHLALAEVQGFVEKYQVEQLAPFPGTVQNIFLLTTCRSGSSFFGEAIASHPAIFYHYEPLLYFSFEESTYLNPIYNKRIRRPGQNLERAFQTLGNLSKCDYSRAPKYMQSLKTYRNMLVLNSKISSPCTKLSYNCFDLDFLKKSCSLFPVQVFKLTRLRGKTAGELLKRFRGSKLIYLVRDPRAIYSSRLETGWCKLNSSFCDIRRLCADLEEDLVEMTAFATENNKNVLLVKYEDMILNTRQNFERVYTFIGLKWHNNVEKYLKVHTNYESDFIMSTYKNSTKHIDKWKSFLANETVQTIQKQCKHFMANFQYTFVK